MRWFVDFVYLLAGLAYLPIALYHALIVGKNRRGWSERFGAVPALDPTKGRIWIHAVSLGEINATPRLVDALRQRLDDVEIAFSTTTDTGYARAVQLYGAECVFRFPLDFSPVIARVLRRVSPSMIVLVELEVWYNLVRMATRRGIPVVVVNGRLTPRSARRFHRLGRAARAMFGDLAWVGAQDLPISSRFRELGVPDERVEVTSSLKWDSATIADRVEGADLLAGAMGIDRSRPLWVCGSTGPGEEVMILDAYRRILNRWEDGPRGVPRSFEDGGAGERPVLAIIPRKPERFTEVARIIERAGFACVRRSEHPDEAKSNRVARASEHLPAQPQTHAHADGDTCSTCPPVFLGDTMGELRKFYSLARVVFIGRSLVPMGGSDPMEVAALGKPMVIGSYTENFELPVAALCEGDAIRVVESAGELSDVIDAILRNPSLAQELAARPRQVVIRNQGAAQRTADKLVALLQAAKAQSSA